MKPILFSVSLPFWGVLLEASSYAAFISLGILCAMAYASLAAPHEKITRRNFLFLAGWLIFFGIFGARLFHVLFDGKLTYYANLCFSPEKERSIDALVGRCIGDVECGLGNVCNLVKQTCHPQKDCWAAVKLWQGGLTYYGGFLFALIATLVYSYRKKLSFLVLADFLSPAVLLGLVFGRIGCFLNGCCYGKPTSLFWGIRFPRGSIPFRDHPDAGHRLGFFSTQPLHPTQLYEALGCLVIFGILMWMRKRKLQAGQRFGFFLYAYAVLRFLCEFFRDDMRGGLLQLSTSQLFSLPLACIGIFFWLGYSRGCFKT